MVGIEAEAADRAVVEGQRDETLTAKIEAEAGLVERPILSNLGAGGEPNDVLAAWPWRADRDRLALECPAADFDRFARVPELKLGDARRQAFEALLCG